MQKGLLTSSMLTKLKYVGTSQADLLIIYKLFIRCLTEYCSVVWHSSLTESQKDDIERIQRVCLRVILDDDYVDYSTARGICQLESLESRRELKCLNYGLMAIRHPKHKTMFPMKQPNKYYSLRKEDPFIVNSSRTNYYAVSSVPYVQRKLNQHFKENGKI